MPTIAVTGATGQLGRLVVTDLLDRGVAAGDLVALVRSAAKASELSARGVQVREADYESPAALSAALTGVDTLLLVSASDPGQRVAQHTNVINAAVNAGVSRIVYTSLLRAGTSAHVLAPDHKATEELIAATGLPHTILRNGWYIENYTDQLATYLATGEITEATNGGKIAGAARADYAAAAAVVLTKPGHDGKIYELGGTPFTVAELAAVITEVTGTTVTDHAVTEAELAAILHEHAGLPVEVAGFVASFDTSTANGLIDTDSDDLTALIGRPSTSVRDVVSAAAAAIG